jgi:hypothetical protein
MSASPNSAMGAILYGLISAAIFAVAVKCAYAPLVRFLIWIGRRLPPRMRPRLRHGADRVFPGWRTAGGLARPPLDWRLQQIRERKRVAYALVGGVYLDLNLHPVNVGELREGEFSGLDSVRLDVGGSAAWVGHYLYGIPEGRQRSFLFSSLGDDAFSQDLRQRVKYADWVKKFHYGEAKYSQCGLSVNLENPNDLPSTTLTHRGSLGSLGWRQILAPLTKCTKRGGIIYISGYFRTNLCNGLSRALEALPAQTVVCIDHGRFQPEDYRHTGAALTKAFSSALVDVYLCSTTEFRDFASGAGVEGAQDRPLEEVIKLCEARQILPPFTVIKGKVGTAPTAYIAHHGDVETIELSHEVAHTHGRVGKQNAFNAGFLHELGSGQPGSDLYTAVAGAVRCALETWASTMQRT